MMRRCVTMLVGTALLVSGCDRPSSAEHDQQKSGASGKLVEHSFQGLDWRPVGSVQTSAEQADDSAFNGEYARILTEVVTENGLVRYDLLQDESRLQALDDVVHQYANAAAPLGEAAQKALWCNAYNANALRMALSESRKDGFKTVKDVPGFFDQMVITVTGESLTLNGLQAKLRRFGDPRIHGALVFGARACPPLRREPFLPARIDDQLNDQCRRWMDDNKKNCVELGRLSLSPIMQWHSDEFEIEPYHGILGFVRKFSRPRGVIRGHIIDNKDVVITFMRYDWRLNQASLDDDPPTGRPGPAKP